MTEMPEVTIHIGGVHASAAPAIIKTVVGSCIAVCLIDPVACVGGMNHFMLPAPAPDREESMDRARFGVHAMDLLVGALQKVGGQRRRLQAKIFGGGHVLQIPRHAESVPERNIRFINEYMLAEGIPVISRDLGGYLPRRIHLATDTGKVQVKRLGAQTLRQKRTEEREHMRALRATRHDSDIVLFDGDGASR
jgi:chemotaxis protein CheD